MSKPTRKDAEIIIRLAELGGSMNIAEGTALIWRPEFDGSPEKLPAASEDYGKVLNVLRWFETIGTLYRNGVVHEDLLFDWLAVSPIWDKVKPIAESQRADLPALWENFEYMAEKQRTWKPKREQKAAKAARPIAPEPEKVATAAKKNGASESS